ncbi:MAG: prepilin-type N-terminal cleavage/methylation domain-containing protein, partial [Planctomycetaceae bacterium]
MNSRRRCSCKRLPPDGRRLCVRRAFTLMEILLVLAVMLVLAGVAYFSMSNAYARRDIDEAVEEVRKELSRTRNYAVDSALM